MLHKIIGIALILGVAACAPLLRPSLPEPKLIVVRNLSGVDLGQVTLSADRSREGDSVRFGSVSPVLNGSSQVTERGTSPRPLPRYVELVWTERAGGTYRQAVDLQPVLGQVSETASFALVFEIRQGGLLNIHIELAK